MHASVPKHLINHDERTQSMKIMKKWIVLFSGVLFLGGSLNAESKIDSLESRLNHANRNDKLELLIALSKECWNVSPQKGLSYSDQAVELAKAVGNQSQEAKALLYGGVNAWFAGSYDLAIRNYQKSLALAETLNDKTLIAYNLNNFGMVNSHLENYEKAIDYYSRASLIMKELGDTIEYAKIVNNIGKLNSLMGDDQEALKKQLSILELVEKSNERSFLLWLLCDIGTLYKKLHNNALARQYFSRALKVSDLIDDQLGKSMVLRNLGIISLENKEYDRAKKYFGESLELALKSDAKEEIKESYKNLSDYYQTVGMYQKALENYQSYKMYSDSTLNESKMNAIIEMETKYEAERKEKENKLLRKNDEIGRLKLEKQTYLKDFFIVLSLIAIIVIIVVSKQFQAKKKLNGILNEQNALLEKTVQEKTKALEAKKLLLSEMNHRVKNNLMVVQSLLNLQSRQLGDAESRTVLQDCANRVKVVSRIHAILSDRINLRAVQTVDYVSRLIDELAVNFDIDPSRIEIILKLEEVRLDINVLVPFALILNELVTNAFKYAFADQTKGTLLVSLTTHENNHIELIVKDDGPGLPEGFKIEESKSMGMQIVSSLVQQISGTLTFDLQKNEGAEFRVSFTNRAL